MGKRFKRSLDLFFDMDKDGDSKMDKVMTYSEVCNLLNEFYDENKVLKERLETLDVTEVEHNEC